MARWLSPSRTPLAEWLWVKPTATGAIVPVMSATAGMVAPTTNNGGVDPAAVTAGAVMPAPVIQVDTGTNTPPLLAAAALAPAPGLLTKETAPRATGSAAMIVPLVWKTIVCFPAPVTFTLSGKVPSIPPGSGRFPSAVALTISGKAPTVSSVTPTTVTPSAASFTITGKVPDEPTGPRFGNYTFPITLN